MNELILSLMVVASHLTGLPIPIENPTVEVITQQELTVLVYGPPGHDEERTHIVRGAFDCPKRTIYIRDTFKSRDKELSTLLHEVVHYLQCRSIRRIFMSRCHRETVAYRAERKFLESRGHDFYEMYGFTPASFATFMDLKCTWKIL